MLGVPTRARNDFQAAPRLDVRALGHSKHADWGTMIKGLKSNSLVGVAKRVKGHIPQQGLEAVRPFSLTILSVLLLPSKGERVTVEAFLYRSEGIRSH
jgi:hypothetical protein